MLYGLIILIIIIVMVLLLRKGNTNGKNKEQQLEEILSINEDKEEIAKALSQAEMKNQKLEIELIRAGIPLKAKEYNLFRMISLFVVFALLFLLTRNLIVSILFTVVWLFIPGIVIKYAQERKKNVLEEQIPVALSLIRNSLQAGFSFLQAMEVVSEEMDAPISEEFARVLHETNIGKDLEVALYNMLHRIPSDELKLVIVAVLIQRQVGGNLGDIIDVILETIKDRIQIKGEIKTLTAQGRLSAMIISGLPVGLGVIMYFVNPTYMSPLLTTTGGQALLGFAGFLELLGVYMISKIVKVDF